MLTGCFSKAKELLQMFRICGVLLIILFSLPLLAQRTGPEQQPCGAINLNCNRVFTTSQAYTGQLTATHGLPAACFKDPTKILNPVFFKFRAMNNGVFKFTITPNAAADYDYWLTDITGKVRGCDWESLFYYLQGTTNGISDQCNTFTSYGATGANQPPGVCDVPSTCAMGAQFNVLQDHEYLLLVSYHNGGQPVTTPAQNIGFTLDASATNLGVIGSIPINAFHYTATICLGSTAHYWVDNPIPDAVYTWSGPNLSSPSGTSVTATPTVTSNYTFTTNYGSCPVNNITVKTTVVPPFSFTASANKTQICRGEQITLSTTGVPPGASYFWSGPGITNPALVTQTITPPANSPSPLIYTVKASFPHDPDKPCVVERTVQVNFIDPESFTLSASPLDICYGASSTITANSSIPGMTYVWSGTGVSGSGSSKVVSPTATTTYTVAGTIPGSTCPAQVKTITVNVLNGFNLSASVNRTRICAGEQTTLTASGAPAGTTYTWSGTGLLSTTGASVVASPSGAGVYTYTVTANVPGSTCSPRTSTVNVTVDQPYSYVVSPASATICKGVTAVFTASSTNPNLAYTWWDPAFNISTGSTFSVTPTATTTYTVVGGIGGSSCAEIKMVTVTVHEPVDFSVVPSQNNVCPGTAVTLTASSATSGIIYNWQTTPPVSGASATVTPSTTTTYQVSGTLPGNVCSPVTKSVTVNVLTPFNFNISAAGGVTQLCSGITTTLYTSGGPADATYTWSGPGLSATTGSYVDVTPTTTGSVTYTVTATSPSYPCPSVKTITFNILPPSNFTLSLTATDTHVCEGEQIIVTAVGAPAGSSFNWSTPGHAAYPPAPNPQSAVYTPYASSPTITAIATAPGYACPVKASINITVDLPFTFDLSSLGNVCPGGSTSITAVGAPQGTDYVWNGGSLSNVHGTWVGVTPTTTTLYTITATAPNNECVVTKQITVGVNTPTPVSVGGSCTNLCATIGTPQLTVGDIAIIRYRGDATDDFVFVPLVNLPAGMQINFSDKGWDGSAFVTNAGDAMFTYVVPAGGIAAGTPTTVSSATYGFDLSDMGDQLFVFQGTEAAPVFIYAVNTGVWQTTGTVTATSSYLPAGLLKGYTATEYTFERENGKYCPNPLGVNTLSGNRTTILYMIGDQTKWLRSSSPTFYAGDEVGVNANWSFSIAPSYTSGLMWNTGATTNCINTSTPGTYTATYTDLHGCQSSASMTSPAFTFTLTTDRPKYCYGDRVTITANNLPAGATIVWSGYTGATIITPNSISFIPDFINITTYATVTAPGYGCSVTQSIAYPMDLPFNVSASSSPANVCPGGSATLTATGLSANTAFTWNGGSLTSATGTTQVVSPTIATTYTVTAKDPANECTVSKQVSVGVYNGPAISVTGGNNSCISTDFCAVLTSTFTLAQGDLVIIRYRADAPDEFVFVPLINLASGTQIKFTDRGWNGTGFVNSTGDNTYTYTAPTDITAGTIIPLTSVLDLSDLGDQVIAYQGPDATPTILYAFNSDRWLTTGAVTSNSSYLPAGLINGYTAIGFPYERDNAKYRPNLGAIITSGTPSYILNQVGIETNWFRSNTPTSGTPDDVGVNSNWVFNITPTPVTPGYVWSTGATTQCITIVNSDTYTVTYTDYHGCDFSVSKSKVVPFDIAPEWATYFGPNVIISDIKISPVTGNLIICGTGNSADYVPAPGNPANIRYYGEASLTSSTGVDYYKTIVAEVSKNGNEVLWVDYVNTKSWSGNAKLDVDVNGDIYVGMIYTADPAFQPAVLKLNSQGIQQWLVKDFFTADAAYWGLNMTTTVDGVYIVFTADCANTFPSPTNTCQGLLSAGVMKLSKINGSPAWTSFFGGTGGVYTRSYGYDITHDDLGDIYFIGDAAGMPGNNSLSLLPPSSTYSTATLKPGGNPVVVKMNPTGAVVWWDLLSEPSFENNYTAGIAVRNNHLYTSNFTGMEWGPSSFNQQVIHRRDATTGSLLFSKTLAIDYTVQPLLDNLFRVYDLTVDEYENVYLTGDLAYASMSVVMPGAADYHNVLTNTTPRVHGDLETFVACFSGTNLMPKWFTYYGVDPSVTTRYSNYQTMQYLSRAVVTDGDGATYIAGIAIGDYNRFEVVDQSAGSPVIDGSNTGSSKGIIAKFTCAASQQAPQTRIQADDASVTAIAYPNPFSNTTKIQISGLPEELCDVTVYSMEGITVYKLQNVSAAQAIEVGEGLPAGMYFVNVKGSMGMNVSLKIVKR